MKPPRAFWFVVVVVLMALLAANFTPVAAQLGGSYELTWNTVDGGGCVSTGGGFEVNGTIGQADAGMLSGGQYTLSGGWWVSAVAIVPSYKLYLPLIVRG